MDFMFETIINPFCKIFPFLSIFLVLQLKGLLLACLKMIYTCTLYPIQWELAKNEGHSVKLQTILH